MKEICPEKVDAVIIIQLVIMSDIIRTSYTFHECFHDALKELSDDQYGRLMRAINEYALYGNEPSPMIGIELMVWKLVCPILAKGRNKANGKAGAPKGNSNNRFSQSKYNQSTIKVQSKYNQNYEGDLFGSVVDDGENMQVIDIEEGGQNDGTIKVQSNNNQSTIKVQSKYNQNEIKEVSPSSPLEENAPKTLKEDKPPISPEENVHTSCAPTSAYEAFRVWLKENCPYVFRNIPIMSEVEFQKLKEQFGSEAMVETFLNLENRKDKRKQYANMYRTMLNWLKRNENDRKASTNHREERLAGYANAIATYLSTD